MTPYLLALTLAASTATARPAPIAPRGAAFALHLPSARASLPAIKDFLDRAGALAPALQPEALGRSLGGSAGANMLDLDALAAAGFDVAGPMTVSSADGALVTCAVASPQALARLDANLAHFGELAHTAVKGARLTGASNGSAWREGYVTRGGTTCIATRAADVLPALKATAAALTGAGLPATLFNNLNGPAYGYFSARKTSAAFVVKAAAGGLHLTGRFLTLPAKLLPAKDGDPFAQLQSTAPVMLTATLDPASVAAPSGPLGDAVATMLAGCKGCDRKVLGGVIDALRPQLGNSTAAIVTRIDPAAATGVEANYFMFPHALLFAAKSAGTARSALDAAVGKLRAAGVRIEEATAAGEGPHYAAAVGEHQVFLGVGPGLIYIANERAARDLALQAASSTPPGKPVAAARLVVNGPAVTSALRRISPLDLLKAPELATMFGFGVEAGALLRAAGAMNGTADPDGTGARFDFGFDFSKEPAP